MVLESVKLNTSNTCADIAGRRPVKEKIEEDQCRENADRKPYGVKKYKMLEEFKMGFWNTVGKLAEKGYEKAKEKAGECMDNYDSSYDRYSSRYSEMSNEQLKREIDRLKRDTSGDTFKRMGKIQAMKDELENRRGY